MNILIVTPAPPGSRNGNRVTAERWAQQLGTLGHRVRVREQFDDREADLLVALHARKSYGSIARFRRKRAGKPIILALTGTDLYRDIRTSRRAQQSLEWADRLVVLQPLALKELPRGFRRKTRVIYQSVKSFNASRAANAGPWGGRRGTSKAQGSRTGATRNQQNQPKFFDVCVIGHLRPVKDPFRCAMASRRLPPTSRIRVLHLGEALSDSMRRRAMREQSNNPRYRWLGALPPDEARRTLARCSLMVLSSIMEGGANVIGEAVTLGVPVVSTRIPGAVGLLGKGYPGYFPVGNNMSLAKLLERAESSPQFLDQLRRGCRNRRGLFEPLAEKKRWKELIRELNDQSSFRTR